MKTVFVLHLPWADLAISAKDVARVIQSSATAVLALPSKVFQDLQRDRARLQVLPCFQKKMDKREILKQLLNYFLQQQQSQQLVELATVLQQKYEEQSQTFTEKQIDLKFRKVMQLSDEEVSYEDQLINAQSLSEMERLLEEGGHFKHFEAALKDSPEQRYYHDSMQNIIFLKKWVGQLQMLHLQP